MPRPIDGTNSSLTLLPPACTDTVPVLLQQLGGNVSLALLLTVSSNILGIFTMPFILPHILAAAPAAAAGASQGLSTGAAVLQPLPLLLQLCKTILVPTLIGATIRGFLPGEEQLKSRRALPVESGPGGSVLLHACKVKGVQLCLCTSAFVCAGAAAAIDARRKLLSYLSAALLALVPWMQVRTDGTGVCGDRACGAGHQLGINAAVAAFPDSQLSCYNSTNFSMLAACCHHPCLLQISKTASQNIGVEPLAVAATALAGLGIHAAFLALNSTMCWWVSWVAGKWAASVAESTAEPHPSHSLHAQVSAARWQGPCGRT